MWLPVNNFTSDVIQIKPVYHVSASIHPRHIHIKAQSHPDDITTCKWAQPWMPCKTWMNVIGRALFISLRVALWRIRHMDVL